MGRGNIEREKKKKKKKDFCLGGTQEGQEFPPLKRYRVCARVKKEEAAQERKTREIFL